MNGEAGKGDARRPSLLTEREETEAWERVMPGSSKIATWYVCPVCNKGAMNSRNPCKVCGGSHAKT